MSTIMRVVGVSSITVIIIGIMLSLVMGASIRTGAAIAKNDSMTIDEGISSIDDAFNQSRKSMQSNLSDSSYALATAQVDPVMTGAKYSFKRGISFGHANPNLATLFYIYYSIVPFVTLAMWYFPRIQKSIREVRR